MSYEDVLKSAIASDVPVLINSAKFGNETIRYKLWNNWAGTHDEKGIPNYEGEAIQAAACTSGYGKPHSSSYGISKLHLVAQRGDYESSSRFIKLYISYASEKGAAGDTESLVIGGLGTFTLTKVNNSTGYVAEVYINNVPQTVKLSGQNVPSDQDNKLALVFTYEQPPNGIRANIAPTPPTPQFTGTPTQLSFNY